MCGITGYFGLSVDATISGSVLETMARRLNHRGPDDFGCVLIEPGPARAWPFTTADRSDLPGRARIGLGHTRLSILDLSPRGHQPMASADGRCWIVYNGEVYNYLELRPQLEAAGHVFQSDSDTEVVLAAYQTWGLDAFKRFNGQWAIALYDGGARRLILSRDRLGKKPLYVYRDPGQVIFGSEIKALLANPVVPCRPDMAKLAAYAGRHYRLVDRDATSYFEGILHAPRGAALVIDLEGRTSEHRFWALDPGTVAAPKTEGEAIEAFRSLLADAVRLRLRSDVPVGSLLSGGLDSTSITTFASQGSTNFTAISAVTGDGYFDESEFIDEVVRATGVKSETIRPEAGDLFADLATMLRFHDEPVCTASWYSFFQMARRVAQHKIPVILTGHGGDEVLAGYWDHYHHHFLDLRRSGLDDGPERSLWMENHRRDPAEYDRERAYVESLAGGPGPFIDRYSRYLGALASPLASLHLPPVPASPFRGALNGRLWSELLYETVAPVLRTEDRNMMAFSIETRIPFLDYRLIEFCFALDGRFKIRDGLGKWILREAMRGLLPEKVRARKEKVGHNAPIATWFRTTNRDDIDGLIGRSGFVNEEVYDRARVRALFDEHLAGADHSMFFWQYINLHTWHDVCLTAPRPSA